MNVIRRMQHDELQLRVAASGGGQGAHRFRVLQSALALSTPSLWSDHSSHYRRKHAHKGFQHEHTPPPPSHHLSHEATRASYLISHCYSDPGRQKPLFYAIIYRSRLSSHRYSSPFQSSPSFCYHSASPSHMPSTYHYYSSPSPPSQRHCLSYLSRPSYYHPPYLSPSLYSPSYGSRSPHSVAYPSHALPSTMNQRPSGSNRDASITRLSTL